MGKYALVIMTLYPSSNDEFYELSLVEGMVCLLIVYEIPRQGLEHLPYSLSFPSVVPRAIA